MPRRKGLPLPLQSRNKMLNHLKFKVMKKMMNKAMAAMMMMAIALAMPAKADNRSHVANSGRRDHAVVVDKNRKDAHFDKKDHKPGHVDKKHAYRPDMKTCKIKVGRHENPRRIEARAKRISGVMEARMNSRTRELTVRYDANKTTARHIRRVIA